MIVFGKCSIGIGIVGGLDPETSAKFLLNVVTHVRKITGKQPNIILDNISVPTRLERQIILGEKSEELFELLKQSIDRVNKANVDIIVIPCNTVHIFFDRLQRISRAPLINIIGQTMLAAKGCKKIGVLATTMTVSSGMFQKSCDKHQIKIILPNKKEQKKISKSIIKILNGRTNRKDKKFLESIIEKLAKKGAEAIVLGCTDLDLLINDKSEIKIIDSTKTLEDAVVNFILKGVENG